MADRADDFAVLDRAALVQATEARGEDPARRLHGAVQHLGILEGRDCSLLTVTCYGWHLGRESSLTMCERGGRTISEDGSALEGVDIRGRFVTKRVRGHGDPADGIPTSSEVLM